MAAPEQSRTARVRARPAPDEPGSVELVLTGAIAPEDIQGLCERARRLLERTQMGPIVCDVNDVVEPDAATVDALSRLQLTARRLGREVFLGRASSELLELIDLMGLADVVSCAESDLEARGQAE